MTAGFNIRMPDLGGRTEVPSVTSDRSSGYITDLSYLAELWNAGPIGRAVALQIADQSIQPATEAVQAAEQETK
jgi:hypothetical protein